MRQAILLPAVLVFAAPASAQESETSSSMMNQHACPGEGFEGMMEVTEARFGPTLSELRDEGMIQDRGVLTHAWGDGYNFNFCISGGCPTRSRSVHDHSESNICYAWRFRCGHRRPIWAP